jgi:hypothetical protein
VWFSCDPNQAVNLPGPWNLFPKLTFADFGDGQRYLLAAPYGGSPQLSLIQVTGRTLEDKTALLPPGIATNPLQLCAGRVGDRDLIVDLAWPAGGGTGHVDMLYERPHDPKSDAGAWKVRDIGDEVEGGSPMGCLIQDQKTLWLTLDPKHTAFTLPDLTELDVPWAYIATPRGDSVQIGWGVGMVPVDGLEVLCALNDFDPPNNFTGPNEVTCYVQLVDGTWARMVEAGEPSARVLGKQGQFRYLEVGQLGGRVAVIIGVLAGFEDARPRVLVYDEVGGK